MSRRARLHLWRVGGIIKRRCYPVSCKAELDGDNDASEESLHISPLTLNGKALRGLPDVVLREKSTQTILVFERKVTRATPRTWPNLKVQLWCYGRADRWSNSPEVSLRGMVYHPDKWEQQTPVPIGDWKRSDEAFDAECSELFELFGGEIGN